MTAKDEPNEVAPCLALEIGKAMVLARLALQEINEANADDMDKLFETSNISPDNFICLLVAMRDQMMEVCRLTGVPT